MIPNPPVRTYRDYIDQLVFKLGAATDERNQGQVRSAVRNAYLSILAKGGWGAPWKQGRIILNPPVTDGTIQYTQSTRTVQWTPNALTQWPAWVSPYCRIRIGTVNSQVSAVPSGTTLTLDSVINPGQDIPAGTTFTLYQNLFPLPGDFQAMGNPRGEVSWWSSKYVSPEEWMAYERAFGGTTNGGIPVAWTIFQDWTPGVYNGLMLAVWPWPSPATNELLNDPSGQTLIPGVTYDYIYSNLGRPLVYTGLETFSQAGTISGTAGGTSITGTGTAFMTAQTGSIIRVGNASTVPTGIEGMSPYVEQHAIGQVVNPTTINLVPGDTLQTDFTSVKYIISDPVTVPESMALAILRRAELELADLKDRGKYAEQEQRYRRAILEAREADQRITSPQFASVTAIATRPPLPLIYMPYLGPTAV